MDKREFALQAHRDWKGKIEVVSRAKVTNREELAVAYTPGVYATASSSLFVTFARETTSILPSHSL